MNPTVPFSPRLSLRTLLLSPKSAILAPLTIPSPYQIHAQPLACLPFLSFVNNLLLLIGSDSSFPWSSPRPLCHYHVFISSCSPRRSSLVLLTRKRYVPRFVLLDAPDTSSLLSPFSAYPTFELRYGTGAAHVRVEQKRNKQCIYNQLPFLT